jgi:hypothetical protein
MEPPAPEDRLTETTASAIASTSPMLRTLQIDSECFDVLLTDAFGTQLGRWCPLLRHVDLSGLQVTDATLVAISRDCAELQSLRLSETHVTDAGLKAIGEGCPGLRAFSLWGGTEAVTDSGLVSLSKGCFGLQAKSRRFTWVLGARVDRHCRNVCAVDGA